MATNSELIVIPATDEYEETKFTVRFEFFPSEAPSTVQPLGEEATFGIVSVKDEQGRLYTNGTNWPTDEQIIEVLKNEHGYV